MCGIAVGFAYNTRTHAHTHIYSIICFGCEISSTCKHWRTIRACRACAWCVCMRVRARVQQKFHCNERDIRTTNHTHQLNGDSECLMRFHWFSRPHCKWFICVECARINVCMSLISDTCCNCECIRLFVCLHSHDGWSLVIWYSSICVCIPIFFIPCCAKQCGCILNRQRAFSYAVVIHHLSSIVLVVVCGHRHRRHHYRQQTSCISQTLATLTSSKHSSLYRKTKCQILLLLMLFFRCVVHTCIPPVHIRCVRPGIGL